MRTILLVLALLLLVAAQARPLTALALTDGTATVYPLDPKLAAYFTEQHVTLVGRPLAQPLNQDVLKQFDFVILTNFMGLRAPWFALGGELEKYYTLKQNIVELQTYVQSGGGLFFIPEFGWAGMEAAQTMGVLLDPWGVGITASSPYDKAHQWQNYGWTTNITKSPVTAGVKTLYYPMIIGRWDDLYPTNVLTIRDPKRWTPLVRGMPGSVTAKNIAFGENAGWYPQPGSQDPPIIAAAGQVGEGRVVIMTISPLYLLTAAYRDPKQKEEGEFTTGAIDGVVVEKGDGATPSQGRQLLLNAFRWIAEPAAKKGYGAYTPEAYAALPAPPKAAVPAWHNGWNKGTSGAWHKVLIGARSAYSDGKGTIAEYAAAAKAAGYGILVMTETFEKLPPEKWDAFYRDCLAATTNDLIVIPGIELPDAYGNRYLLFGQSVYPQAFMLTEDRKAIKQVQFLMLGLRPSMSAIARPSTTPGDHHLHKFYSGYAVYTYRNGALIDDGTLGYLWAGQGWSDPLPLVVHETFAPADVAKEAAAGHQLYVPADTLQNAAWYLRQGEAHYWEAAPRFLVSAGPMITDLSPKMITVTDDALITEMKYVTSTGTVLRRWKPNANTATAEISYPAGNLTTGYMVVTDEKGRTAITPTLTGGSGFGYNKRCSDRQNFFSVPIHYPGTALTGGYNISVPAYGTREGQSLWPDANGPRRGENMAPLLEFPYVSPALSVTDAYLDMRYWRAQWEDAAFDARSPQGTVRSRVYDGRFRYYDYHYQRYDEFIRQSERNMMIAEITLRLRTPVTPAGDVFPVFYNFNPNPTVQTIGPDGAPVQTKLTKGSMDLPVGACVNNLLVLSPGLRVDSRGNVGFAVMPEMPLPAFTAWSARVTTVDTAKLDLAEMQRVLIGKIAPYKLTLTRGTLNDIAFVASLTAQGCGVAGTVAPYAKMPFALPLHIDGANPYWPAGIWRPGAAPVACGVFENKAVARLDVTKDGAFYAGNLVTAGDPTLRIALLDWTAAGITLEVNNVSDNPVATTLNTPAEITGLFPLRDAPVKLNPGECKRLTFK